jgi:predicted permease
MEARLDAELRDHFEREVAARVQAGATETEARRATRLASGGLEQVKEQVRDVAPARWLDQLARDIRHGVRSLRRSPALTAAVVLTLAVGIGANTAIFHLVNAVLLRRLPVHEPERLALFSDGAQECARQLGAPPGRRIVYSYPLYQRLRGQSQSFAGIAAQESCSTPSIVQGKGAVERATERADGRAVSASYFDVLGVAAQRGRTFLPEDESAPGANPVVVLSHGFWQRRFGGDPGLVGGRLAINGVWYTVVGVTQPDFTGGETGSRTDFWVPVTMQEPLTRLGFDLHDRHYSSLVLFGRLPPGVSMAAAQGEADLVYHRWLAEDPDDAQAEAQRRTRILLDPGATGLFPLREEFRAALLVLLAAVGLLLVIVCLNVCHLLLARAIGRRPEMSIRAALGASRARLARQIATEGLLLSGLSAALGAALAGPLSAGLLALVADGRWAQPLALDLSLDLRVLAFTAVLALAAALVVGWLPARQALRTDLQLSLRAGATAVTGGADSRRLATRLLLVGQVAVSMTLLVGAGLLTASLGRLRNVPTGFEVGHTLLADLNLQVAGIDWQQAPALYQDLQRRVSALPGVRSASLSAGAPLDGGGLTWGLTARSTKQGWSIVVELVTAGYFETMGMTLLRGRTLGETDGASSPRVAVINEQLARRAFGGVEAAIGARYRLDLDPGPDIEVVGVVRDAQTIDLRSPAHPMVYQLATQPHGLPPKLFLGHLQVRAEGDPALLADQIRGAVRDAHSGVPVLGVRTMRAQLDRYLMRERLLATLSTTFGLSALFLVCLGLYGVISQWTARRRREIGLRLALGATPRKVRGMVLRQGIALVIAGVAAGLPMAVAAGHAVKHLLFGVPPIDPRALAVAAAILLTVSALAAYLPAWRASRADPMTALRQE